MKKKLWISSVLAALSITAVATGIALNEKQDTGIITVNAAENWEIGDIDNTYLYGTSFEVPAAKVEVGGEMVDAVATVTYPNGVVIKTDNVPLNQAGLYTVSYRAVVGNVHYVEEKSFNVENSAYLAQNENSTVEYGTYTKFGANSEGLLVRLAPNDTLTFSQLIDVEDISGTNSIIDLFVTPNAMAVYDFSKLVIRLTDAVDPSVYVQYQLRRYNAEDRAFNWGYVDVSFNGQPWVGYERGYRINGWGSPISFTFYAAMHKGNQWSGEVVERTPDIDKCRIVFDPLTTEARAGNVHIANLNNPTLFEQEWKGWPSGKVRLSLKAEEVKSETANFCITKVMGMDDLSKNSFVETEAPLVSVSMAEDEMPTGEVGADYPIPMATAFDMYSGDCNTKVSVYRDYASDTPISVGVVNGKFKPTVAGWHTIVYKAKDVLGNEGETIRNVYVENDLGDITITLPDAMVTEIALGEWVPVNAASYTGDCGIANMKITASLGEETYEITDGFRPEKAGDWKVQYTVTDYIGRSATAEYTVKAEAKEGYVLLDKLTLPKIFVSDSEYVLPVLYATSYATGEAVRTLCDVVVSDNNGDTTYTAGQSFKPSVVNNGDIVTVSYQCDGYVLETRKIPAILVKDENGGFIVQNYLFGEGFTTSYIGENGRKYSAGIEVIADNASELCGWTFATPQIMNNFKLEFEGIANKTNFESLIITLTDSKNENEQISVELKVRPNGATVVVGDKSVDTESVNMAANKAYALSYAKGKFSFGGLNIAAEKTVNGETFNGFSSSLAYVRVEMKNARKGASYKLRSINESNISWRNLEVFAPNFEILGDFGGNQLLNSVFDIPTAVANPCPRAPVVASILFDRFNSGCPGV